MMLLKLVLVLVMTRWAKSENLQFLTKIRSAYLEKYEGYENVVILHLNIPRETLFASFMFLADEINLSIFGCSPRDVSLYMKHGSPPVVNPDGSKFPVLFKNITRSPLYELEIKTDKVKKYINITSPKPGPYFIVSFLSYTDPKQNAITQQGLAPRCVPQVESTIFIQKILNPTIILENQKISTSASLNESKYFKFYVPESTDHAILELEDITFSENADTLIVRIQENNVPSFNNSLKSENIYSNITSADILFWVQEDTWDYIEFIFANTANNKTFNETSSLKFSLTFFSNKLMTGLRMIQNNDNDTVYNSSILKSHRSNKLTEIVPYQQYNLVRESSTDSFIFTYELQSELDSTVPIAINMTSDHFTALKFNVFESTDIGGTLQYILAFKPRIKDKRTIESEPEDHVIVACIRANNIEVPIWPNKCSYNGIVRDSPLILNKTVENSTVLVPYPESGTWYATFKLFCGQCEPCVCPDSCQKLYETCTIDCELNCNSKENCSTCVVLCSQKIFTLENCKGCDCDGPCKRKNTVCNSSVIFDVSSQPCISGECSRNGRCTIMVSSGIVYSTCVCSNHYRGWDCTDGSQATPYWRVVLELLLLVISNLTFLPSVYVAFKRKYYVEALTYFAICFFSTFYHACDAGEKIISFCITRISALQFGDFFCALLAIWVTLIAIADLPSFWPSFFHMGGAIVLSFCTTIDKTSLWVFAVPAITGLVIIGGNWYLKYRKIKQMFVNKKYIYVFVPVGTLLVVIGLLIYSLLQTESNYMYLHSMWHMIMAVAVVILLPKTDTFLPEILL